jgi:hypothetical protein
MNAPPQTVTVYAVQWEIGDDFLLTVCDSEPELRATITQLQDIAVDFRWWAL